MQSIGLPHMDLKPSPTVPLAMLFAAAVAALGGLLFGFDTAVIAGITHALTSRFHLTSTTLGVTVSFALWGTVVGSLLAFLPANRLGGRDSLRLSGLLYLVSAVGCALAGSWYAFLAFRFIGGLAIGGCSVFAPMYIAEASPPAARGKLVSCFQLSIVTGILVAYGSNFVIGSLHLLVELWRLQLGVAAFPSLLFLAALFFIPRSPYWLLKHNRISEARSSLQTLGFPAPEEEIQRIQASFLINREDARRSIFRREYTRPVLIALALGLFNQLSGINAILYYANDIFTRAGYGSASAGKQAVALGLTNLLFTVLGMSFIDSLGRKPLLVAGAGGNGDCLGGHFRNLLFRKPSASLDCFSSSVHCFVCCVAGRGGMGLPKRDLPDRCSRKRAKPRQLLALAAYRNGCRRVSARGGIFDDGPFCRVLRNLCSPGRHRDLPLSGDAWPSA